MQRQMHSLPSTSYSSGQSLTERRLAPISRPSQRGTFIVRAATTIPKQVSYFHDSKSAILASLLPALGRYQHSMLNQDSFIATGDPKSLLSCFLYAFLTTGNTDLYLCALSQLNLLCKPSILQASQTELN